MTENETPNVEKVLCEGKLGKLNVRVILLSANNSDTRRVWRVETRNDSEVDWAVWHWYYTEKSAMDVYRYLVEDDDFDLPEETEEEENEE